MEKELSSQGEVQSRVDSKRKRNRTKKILVNLLVFILSAAFWSGAVYHGYTYAKDYIDTSIRNVQQENALNIQELTGRIELLSQEIKNLRDSIEDTDSTISSSTSVQKRIDRKLKELDDQLTELERSLEILKEAPNV